MYRKLLVNVTIHILLSIEVKLTIYMEIGPIHAKTLRLIVWSLCKIYIFYTWSKFTRGYVFNMTQGAFRSVGYANFNISKLTFSDLKQKWFRFFHKSLSSYYDYSNKRAFLSFLLRFQAFNFNTSAHLQSFKKIR